MKIFKALALALVLIHFAESFTAKGGFAHQEQPLRIVMIESQALSIY